MEYKVVQAEEEIIKFISFYKSNLAPAPLPLPYFKLVENCIGDLVINPSNP